MKMKDLDVSLENEERGRDMALIGLEKIIDGINANANYNST